VAGTSRRRTHPEALGSPSGYVVRRSRRLLWPHPSHSLPPTGLFASSGGRFGHEWVPNLSGVSVRACHPQHPGGSCGSMRPRRFRPLWSSPSPQRLDIHIPHARWFPRGLCNEAESSSLALRPARLLALHHQGRLLPSFPQPGRPTEVGYHYVGVRSTPTTGLAPARHAAVWAANGDTEGRSREMNPPPRRAR